jgi:hypothetical protein
MTVGERPTSDTERSERASKCYGLQWPAASDAWTLKYHVPAAKPLKLAGQVDVEHPGAATATQPATWLNKS